VEGQNKKVLSKLHFDQQLPNRLATCQINLGLLRAFSTELVFLENINLENSILYQTKQFLKCPSGIEDDL
jgi:hypothetical protein